MKKRIYIFDTTLRDGAQTSGIDFSLADKQAIAAALDGLGVDYVEGGWPGANPTDDRFFEADPAFRNAKFTAFGMTRRPGRSADNDPGLNALIGSSASVITLVGKSWDYHVDLALEIPRAENLAMIGDSIQQVVANKKEAIFDAEHFFDGYKANPDYAYACVKAAFDHGAAWLVLCDTNGGSQPHEIEQIVGEIIQKMPDAKFGIHAHNDTEQAVANSIAAVRAGATQVQGTINGLGERCGNANLMSLIPNLQLKHGYDCGFDAASLSKLTHISRLLDERLNRNPNRHLPYVGDGAFAHKGGLHVSAVSKDPKTYEHIDPSLVGNRRHIVVSDQAGRSNVQSQLANAGIELNKQETDSLLGELKSLEHQGYSFDGAEASFELLALKALGKRKQFFEIERFRVIDERRVSALNEVITESEATVWVKHHGHSMLQVAMGTGPVHAIDNAIRNMLSMIYPCLATMTLIDYKVRILPPSTTKTGTESITRVNIESKDHAGNRWLTVGVSDNIIAASVQALCDAIDYKLIMLNDQ
ncbi:MAG: citramalate synthase [Alphaproteobacteria bacterium]